jgi:hypothetical protein
VFWIAIIIAVIVTYLGSRLIKAQKKSRQEQMEDLARKTVNTGASLSVAQAVDNDLFIKQCAALSDKAEGEVRARARFYANYANTDPNWVRYYVLQEGDALSACHLIALLTDLPPLWILDCYTNWKGLIPETKAPIQQ